MECPNGSWFLQYASFDSSENEIFHAISQKRIKLESDNEVDATAEAVAIWITKCNPFSVKQWDGQYYPRDPVLVFYYETKAI